jgi:hypothetical protein
MRIYFLTLYMLTACLDRSKYSPDDDDDDDDDDDEDEGSSAGDCNDGIDNDDDGFIDCNDQGCSGKPACSDTGSDTDGNVGGSYGPSNDWYHTNESTINDSGECGYSVGQQACNFILTDQNGDSVELYQFWGQVISIDIIGET